MAGKHWGSRDLLRPSEGQGWMCWACRGLGGGGCSPAEELWEAPAQIWLASCHGKSSKWGRGLQRICWSPFPMPQGLRSSSGARLPQANPESQLLPQAASASSKGQRHGAQVRQCLKALGSGPQHKASTDRSLWGQYHIPMAFCLQPLIDTS